MIEESVSFTGDMPDYYDKFIYPINVQPFAMEIAARVEALKPCKLLEIAAGTGAASECLINRLNGDVSYTLTDISDDMLKNARQRFQGSSQISFDVVDATTIPYEDESFDTLVCQLGLMFFSDKFLALKEFKRVLQPEGKLVFSVWDSLEYHPLIHTVYEHIETLFGFTNSCYVGMPYSFFQLDIIKAMLEKSGYKRMAFEVITLPIPTASVSMTVEGMIKGTPLGEHLISSGIEDIDAAITALKKPIQKEFGDPLENIQRQAIIVTAS